MAWRPIKRWEKPFGYYVCQWPLSDSICTRVYDIAKYQWTRFFEMLNKCYFTLVSYFNRSYERNRVLKENISTFRTRIRFFFFFSEKFFSKHFYVWFHIVCLLVNFSKCVYFLSPLFFSVLFRLSVYIRRQMHVETRRHWNIFTWIVCLPLLMVAIRDSPLAWKSQGARSWLIEDITKLNATI